MIDENIYSRVQKLKFELESLRPLPKSALDRLRKNFEIEMTYNSNAIEGNTLTLKETRLVLELGITIGGKSIKEHLETINHKRAIGYLENISKKTITEKIILALNSIILEGIYPQDRGKYRMRRVRIAGAKFDPIEPYLIHDEMDKLFKWFKKNPSKLDVIELAAIFHHKLVYIHPFVDGNGRTARLAMNFILMQHGYPPTIILNNDRKRYYRTLSQADEGDYVPFINFIGRAVERQLVIYLDAIKTDKNRYEKLLTLAEAAKGTPYSSEYLSLLARKGRLGAIKIQRNWMVSKKAIDDYIKSKKRG